MDSRFRIPGTNIHFGFDALIGLVPGVGDLISFLISGFIISSAAKQGASGYVQARMVFNVAIDTLFGSVPIIGDIFDVFFKSNQRNMQLLTEHFEEGKHQGSRSKFTTPLLMVLLVLFAGFIWLCYKVITWIF